jgi:SAM-dependent methyltransferase
LSRRNLHPPSAPSKTLIRFLDRITSSYGAPILDAPCGFGRNALPLADKGFTVIAVDKNLVRLNSLQKSISEKASPVGKVFPLCADLTKGRLPFGPRSFSAILCIHYPIQNILADFDDQLTDGGHLFIETFGGHGHNYLELPKADEIRQVLKGYKLLFYNERYEALSSSSSGRGFVPMAEPSRITSTRRNMPQFSIRGFKSGFQSIPAIRLDTTTSSNQKERSTKLLRAF